MYEDPRKPCEKSRNVDLAELRDRLAELPHDRRDVGRHAPVVVVPPHPVALVHADRRGALVGLDAVDIEEPVDRPAALLAKVKTAVARIS